MKRAGRKRRKLYRVVASLLTLCMIVTMFSGLGSKQVKAAPDAGMESGSVTADITTESEKSTADTTEESVGETGDTADGAGDMSGEADPDTQGDSENGQDSDSTDGEPAQPDETQSTAPVLGENDFAVNGIVLQNEYSWTDEDGIFTLNAVFSGNAVTDAEINADTVPEFTVTVEDITEEQAQADDAKENDEETLSGEPMLSLRLHLSVDGQEIDLSGCRVSVALTADTQQLAPQASAISADVPLDGAEGADGISAEQGDITSDGQVTEIAVVVDDETMASLPVVTDSPKAEAEFDLENASDGIMLLAVEESANPKFILQHYYWFPEVQRAAGGDQTNLEFVDTSIDGYKASEKPTGNQLPDNTSTKSVLESEKRLFNVNLEDINDQHRLTTKDALVLFFADETTDYLSDPQIRYMSHLHNQGQTNEYNANYRLDEVWVYQPKLTEDGKVDPQDQYVNVDGNGIVTLKQSESEIPFIVYSVPSEKWNDPESVIRFTNNKANPHLTIPYDKRVEISKAEDPTSIMDDASETPYLTQYSHMDSIDHTSTPYNNVYTLSGERGNTDRDYPYTYTILIQTGTIVRLVTAGTESDKDVNQPANFFDYNIGDGYVYDSEENARNHNGTGQLDSSNVDGSYANRSLYMWTYHSGINSDSNYKDSGAKIAFGNANGSTGLEREQWQNQTLNLYNSNTYKGATFGLVSGISDYEKLENGNYMPRLIWSSGVNGVQWFSRYDSYSDGENKVEGKFAYPAGSDNSYSLGFYRKGSTYTLSSVANNDDVILSNLRSFQNTAVNSGTQEIIMSNEFWPMDKVGSTSGHDFKFGSYNSSNTNGTHKRFLTGKKDDGSTENEIDRNEVGPLSDGVFKGQATDVTDDKLDKDDRHDHNSFFGMSYTVDFTIEPGYRAPLAYWFYGDDDMWVFLQKLDSKGGEPTAWEDGSEDAKLVADIGGVHSSIGEYVNLWDYVGKVNYGDPAESYRLTIFYTERGASGSTCYMRFSVPMDTTEPITVTRNEEVVIEKQEIDGNTGEMIDYLTDTDQDKIPDLENNRVIFQYKQDDGTYQDYDANWWPPDIGTLEGQLQNGDLKMKDGYFLFKMMMGNGGSEIAGQVGTVYHDAYDYAIYDRSITSDHTSAEAKNQRLEWGTIGDQATDEGAYYFALRSDEYIVITGLPAGTYYTVEEINSGDYVTGWQKGTHFHKGDEDDELKLAETLDGMIRYKYSTEATDSPAFAAAVTNYIRFTNSPALKTEPTPGDGKPAEEGDEIQYNIYWVNDTSGQQNVIIRDRLDPGVDFVGAKFGDDQTGTYWEPTKEELEGLEKRLQSEAPENIYLEYRGTSGDIIRYYPSYKYDPSVEPNTDDVPVVQQRLLEMYGEPGPTVIWTRQGTGTENGGAVSLKVRVNAKAGDPETEPGKFNTQVPRVENQAGVQVGNESFVLTEIVENPSWSPEKTETEVDHSANPDEFDPDRVDSPPMEDIPGGVLGPLVRPGDKIKYRITWKNYQSTPSMVYIRDPLDKNVTYVDGTAKAYKYPDPNDLDEKTGRPQTPAEETNNVIFFYKESDRTLYWTFGTQDPGAQGYVEFEVEVNPDASSVGHVWNWGYVQVGNDSQMETQHIRNNTPEDPHKSELSPGENNGVKVGDVIRYEISYNNFEAEPVTVTITDRLDDGLDYVEGTADRGGTYDAATRTLKWTLKNVPADSHGTVHFSAKVNENSLTWVENTATVKIGDNPEQNTETVPNPVPHKESDPVSGTPVMVGKDIQYTITYKNTDDEPATIKIRDPIDRGLTVKVETISDGGVWTAPQNPEESGGEIIWTLENVPAGEEGSVTFTATVNERAAAWVENTAFVTFGNGSEVQTETLDHPIPDGAPHKTEVTPGDGIGVSVGEIITYRISYQNDTAATADITIRDPLDVGNTFVSATDGGTYDPASHTVTWIIRGVEPGDVGFVELTVRVNDKAEQKQRVDNTAYVRVGNGPEKQTETVQNPLDDHENPSGNPSEEGDLDVTKKVTGKGGEKDRDWHFRVELSDRGISGTYGDMTFADGVAEFTLKGGEHKTATGLTAGTEYTVVEKEANQYGYTTTIEGKSGTIPAAGIARARFKNHKGEPQKGDLEVNKKVTGTAGDKTREWHFHVKLDDKDIDGTYGDMTFKDGVAEFTLKDGQTMTAAGLPEGTEYTVTEEEANEDGYNTTSKGETGTIKADGKAVAKFTNHKDEPDTPDNPDEPGTPDKVKTDDSGNVRPWLTLMAIALCGAAIAGVMLVRGHRRSGRR